MLSESQILSIDILLNEAINTLLESSSDKPSPTYEWDIVKEKLESSTKSIKTSEQAKNYLDTLILKGKKLPKKLKLKLLKYAFASLVGILSYAEMHDYASKNVDEINGEVSTIDLGMNLNTDNEEQFEKKIDNDVDKEEVENVFYSEIPNDVSDSLMDFIKIEEGAIKEKGEPVLQAYDLGDGMITVGWGHAEKKSNSQFKVGEKITRKKAEELLLNDLASAKNAVNSVFEDWEADRIPFYVDQDMYDAMVSMAFNMGRGGFRSTDFIQMVKKGMYKEAGDKILSTRVSYPGHVKRRQKESDMFVKSLEFNPLILKNKKSQDIISENHKKRLKKLAGLL